MIKARAAYEDETDIIDILRKLRFLQVAVTSLLDEEKNKKFQQKNHFKIIKVETQDGDVRNQLNYDREDDS